MSHLPARPEHEVIHEALLQWATRLSTAWLEFADWAQQAINKAVYARYGYPGAEEYFDQAIGFRYRTVRRWLTVRAAVEALPKADQAMARAALAGVGAHKAAVLAPALIQNPGAWRTWVDRAADVSEAALQEAVSDSLGSKPRGGAVAPGEKWFRFTLAQCPPDTHEQVERVFAAGRRLGGTENNFAVFLAMVAECDGEWALRAAHGERG